MEVGDLDVTARLRRKLNGVLDKSKIPEQQIGDLAAKLGLKEVFAAVADVLNSTGFTSTLLIDRLDDGYEPDECGIGIVNGLIQATIDVSTQLPPVRAAVFVRDNVFRAVAQNDPDYSLNIEGQVLRLHWDERLLFQMICQRLRAAFQLDLENDRKVWNRCTARELQEGGGFAWCLRFTLYRLRDLLLLLNAAFYQALRENRDTIIPSDLEANAKTISINRLEDLHKEYSATIVSLRNFTTAFANGSPELHLAEAEQIIGNVMAKDGYEPPVQQELLLFDRPLNVVRALYSVGFFGVRDRVTGSFVFCHDGQSPTREFSNEDKLLIHPCYWMGLNLARCALKIEDATEIHDEYEIEVFSTTPEIRNAKIGQMISEVRKVPQGVEGASGFENWCLWAIRIAFAGELRNIELHPNGNAPQRRDVVARNPAEVGVWKRIHADYGARQVIFEIKNQEGLGPDEYRQMLSYLTGEYGRVGFIITRDKSIDLAKGSPELTWADEMYHKHERLIIKLTDGFLCDVLSKLRSPHKHNHGDLLLNKLVDRYVRLYF